MEFVDKVSLKRGGFYYPFCHFQALALEFTSMSMSSLSLHLLCFQVKPSRPFLSPFLVIITSLLDARTTALGIANLEIDIYF